MITRKFHRYNQNNNLDDIHLHCTYSGVVHPIIKEIITKYSKLIADPVTREIWGKSICKKLGRLVQGYQDIPGTKTMQFMAHKIIKHIPQERSITYTRMVVDYSSHKEDPNRVCIMVGDMTRTTDLITTKIM